LRSWSGPIVVHEEETLDLLAGAGCSISEKNRVRIPGYLVEEALRSVSKRCTFPIGTDRKLLMRIGNLTGDGFDTPYTRFVYG
jgi:trimethylamine:corrinoid methyltransferase-like protein